LIGIWRRDQEIISVLENRKRFTDRQPRKRRYFFEKKKPKNFWTASGGFGAAGDARSGAKDFCALFSKSASY
jgi:hypothetical protein